jgi:hypothetical protein
LVLEPKDLMKYHAWTSINVLISNIIKKLISSGSLRVDRSISRVEVLPCVQSRFVDLAEYLEFLTTSTSTHATTKSEDVEGIQIQRYVARHTSSK